MDAHMYDLQVCVCVCVELRGYAGMQVYGCVLAMQYAGVQMCVRCAYVHCVGCAHFEGVQKCNV